MKSHSNTYLPAMAFGVLMTNSFEASAEVQWAIHLGGSGEESWYDIALDDDGNLFVSGSTSSTDFDGATNANHGGPDAFVMRLDVAEPCPADLDGDGTVGIGDFLVVLGAWGGAGGDTNDDGTTDILDFLAVLGGWGPCP